MSPLPRINILSPFVADLIAAGEVVERPASVVKELLENAVDAGARNVTVELRGGGREFIRVTDDGCGMSPEDAGIAFLRHATSKLQNERGLEAIGTLGFRGEALAAISSVSHIELAACERGADLGVRMKLDAGEIVDMYETGCPSGTTMIVRGLFYNTPARLKFMKSDRSEGAACVQAALRCALGRPDISFRCIKDGAEEFFTPGDGRKESAVYSLLGRNLASGMLGIELEEGPVRVSGCVTEPAVARGNRSAQFFFCNGRYIRSQLLQAAVEQAYRGTLLTGRFPACVVYIDLAPAAVDVNVHPAKTEVKFSDERRVYDAVYYAVRGALETPRRPEAAPEPEATPEPVQERLPETEPLPPQEKEPMFAGEREPVRVIGEALELYILAQQGDNLLVIDKHAAHERMIYDRLRRREAEVMSQTCLEPVPYTPDRAAAAALSEELPLINSLGFGLEPFGNGTFVLRSTPCGLEPGEALSALDELAEALLSSRRPDKNAARDELLKTVACKAAIKAGRSSEPEELLRLAEAVCSGEVRYCPHGRPVVWALTRRDLDKQFRRIL